MSESSSSFDFLCYQYVDLQRLTTSLDQAASANDVPSHAKHALDDATKQLKRITDDVRRRMHTVTETRTTDSPETDDEDEEPLPPPPSKKRRSAPPTVAAPAPVSSSVKSATKSQKKVSSERNRSCGVCGVFGHDSRSWMCLKRILTSTEQRRKTGWYACYDPAGRYSTVRIDEKSINTLVYYSKRVGEEYFLVERFDSQKDAIDFARTGRIRGG